MSDSAGRTALLTTELERFITVISSEMQPEQVVLFGSAVQSQVNEWTDLDLVVIAETDLPFCERTGHLLKRVSPQVGMDVLVYTPAEWTQMKRDRPFIRQEVIEKGRVVYERGG